MAIHTRSRHAYLIQPVLAAAVLCSLSACPGSVEPNRYRDSIDHGGLTRDFIVYAPASALSKGSVPLLIVLHGGFSNAWQMELLTGFDSVADANGFLVVYPDGVQQEWNDDDITLWSGDTVDDVGFIVAMLDKLSAEYAVDPSRIYVAGMSNGGMMAFRLACEMTDRFAAIATVASSMSVALADACAPSGELPLLMIQGTEDPSVTWDGGPSLFVEPLLAPLDTASFWAHQNGATVASPNKLLPDLAPTDGTRVKRQRFKTPGGELRLVFYTVQGGGHTWPGGKVQIESLQGAVSNDIDATSIVWAFLSQFAKP